MKQQPLLGFLFALIAALMWGCLPIALKQILTIMDSQTIVWYRFFVAAVVLLSLFIFKQKNYKSLFALSWSQLSWIGMGIFGLAANFFLYNLALQYIPPTTSQVLSPLSSFAMLLAGVFLFKEQLGIHQKIGFLFLIIGLILFFNDRLEDVIQLSLYFKGVLIACLASLIWLNYGIAQKLLLTRFHASQILLIFYCGCALVFTPFAHGQQIWLLDHFQLACLVFACLNTVIAYGSYAKALDYWDITKVSAMMTQIPIFTIIFSELLTNLSPTHFISPNLNWLSYLGALVVVSGALLSAIGHKLKL